MIALLVTRCRVSLYSTSNLTLYLTSLTLAVRSACAGILQLQKLCIPKLGDIYWYLENIKNSIFLFSDMKYFIDGWALETIGKIFLNRRLNGIKTARNPAPDIADLRSSYEVFIDLFQPLRASGFIWHKYPNLRSALDQITL